MQRKLMFLSIGFTAAVIAGQLFSARSILLLAFSVSILITLAVFTVKGYRKAAAFLAVGILFGSLWSEFYIYRSEKLLPQNITDKVCQVTARVIDYPKVTKKGDLISFEAKVDRVAGVKLKRALNVIVYYPSVQVTLKPGDTVNVSAEFVAAENNEAFAMDTYYKARGIDYSLFCEEKMAVKQCDKVPLRYFYKVLGKSIRTRINRLLPENEAGFLIALLTGNKDGMTDAFKEELRITGLSHTVAVSGMHIAFLVTLIVKLIGRRHAPFVVIPIMLIFMLVVGSTPSVMRAVIMQSFLLTAPFVMRESDSVTSLFTALMIILIINPYAICDIGLQLSFAAALGIILVSTKLSDYLIRKFSINVYKCYGKILAKAVSAFSATVGATVFSLPIVVYYFDALSVISVISNIVILWAISILFSWGVAIVALSYVWYNGAKFLSYVILYIIRGIYFVVGVLSDIPYASIYGKGVFAVAGIAAGYGVVILWYTYRGRKNRISKILTGILAVTSAAFLCASVCVGKNYDMRLTVFNVGQGLSVMAEHADARVVVDCGGNRLNAGDTVCESLIKSNVRDVDALILTHIHDDHINGAVALMSKADVKTVYIPARVVGKAEIEKLIKIANQKRIKIYAVEEDMLLSFGDMSVKLIYCDADSSEETSTVAIIEKDEFETVITGDLSGAGEKYLTENKKLPDAEVYVVGHHGSKSSSTKDFLDAIRPEFAIISAGENNVHGHPHTETLDRLEECGVYTVCTYDCGNIIFDATDAEKIREYKHIR